MPPGAGNCRAWPSRSSTPPASRGGCGPRRCSRSGRASRGPALRRGALVAVPVGLALLVELGFDAPTKGAIATGALLAGFPGLDAPARTRAAWQAAVAPLDRPRRGARRPQRPVAPCSRCWRWALVGAAAGYCFAVSLRLAIAGLSVALSLLIAQGLPSSRPTRCRRCSSPPPAACSRPPSRSASRRRRRPRRGGRSSRLEHPSSHGRPRAPTSPCARPAPATRCASAPPSPPASPPTGCSGWRSTASGSR